MAVSIGGAAAGAAGGFAVGGPVGAALGGIAGLFGGGGSQETTISRREYTPAERRAVQQIMQMYPGALEAMSPEAREQVFGQISTLIRERGEEEVNRIFDERDSQQAAAFARSGGSLGSIDIYRQSVSNRQRGQAMSDVNLNAILGGEQVAGARQNEAMQRVGVLGSQYAGFDNLRTIGQTTTGQNNPMNAGFGLLGMASTMENSYLNQNILA